MATLRSEHFLNYIDSRLKAFLRSHDAFEAYYINMLRKFNTAGHIDTSTVNISVMKDVLGSSFVGMIHEGTIKDAFRWAGSEIPGHISESTSSDRYWEEISRQWRTYIVSMSELPSHLEPVSHEENTDDSDFFDDITVQALTDNFKHLKLLRTSNNHHDALKLLTHLSDVKYPKNMKSNERKAFWLSKI